MNAEPIIQATQSDLAAAFTEWDRRFREEPERFVSEATRLLKNNAETYGEECAPYLIEILREQRGKDRNCPSNDKENEANQDA